ncbi:hypothetical protein BKA67DRAFT_581170 [Truncatella angustata]|uniref:Uncharacterized protein n=1 Tax=Truncatella angustata TaxID=152316 RepID=A0A9P8RJJ1_9PEZI|nr:uncharacterized protein BKA67DRAFT_581170 [Truncatella angustata]KAH6646979.1 hypothetical protein BKA67DRAFT_581170 [Truncatella angustata]
MTMRYTDMPGSEARQILDQLSKDELDCVKSDAEGSIRATFMVNLDLAFTDPERAGPRMWHAISSF